MSENVDYHNSVVGEVDYIICECGEDFASEELLKEHLNNDHVTLSEELPEELLKNDQEDHSEEEPHELHYEENEVFMEINKNVADEEMGIEIEVPANNFVQEQEPVRETFEEIIKFEEAYENTTGDEDLLDEASRYSQFDSTTFQEVILPEVPDYEEIVANFTVNGENNEYEGEVFDEASEQDRGLTIATESLLSDGTIIKQEPVEIMTTEELLAQHLTNDHNGVLSITEGSIIRLCELCKKVFLSERTFMTHFKKCHMVKPMKMKPKPKCPLGRQKYKNKMCEVCGRSFSSNAALTYHQRTHTGERPYACEVCDKKFTMPLLLQIHFRIHTGERPFQCKVCPKAFSNKAAINRHNRVHTGVKPYICPECGKGFTQSNSKKLHIRTVHLGLPAPYLSKKRQLQQLERLRLQQQNARTNSDKEVSEQETLTTLKKVKKFNAIKIPEQIHVKIEPDDTEQPSEPEIKKLTTITLSKTQLLKLISEKKVLCAKEERQ